MIVAVILMLVVGVALTAVGLRGRRTDDHPLCRRCGFDLTGRPDTSDRCPECGADLREPRAITVGHRRRRKRLVAAGVAIGAAAIGTGSVVGSDWARQVNWWPFVPTGLLLRSATSADPTRRSPALAEVARRMADGSTAATVRARVVAAGLDYQGDPSKPWDGGWGMLLEGERTAGRLTAEQWARYARQAMPPSMFGLRVRRRVRRGDPVPYWLDAGRGRAAPSSVLMCVVDHVQLVWDGQPWRTDTSTGSDTFSFGGGSAVGSSVQPDDVPAGLADGTQHVHLHATATLRARTANGWDVDEKVQPLATIQVDLPATFDLVPADRPTVAAIHDPALADRVRAAIHVDSVRQRSGPSPYIRVDVTVDAPPVGLGFRIVVVQGGHETPAGTLACAAGAANCRYGTGGTGLLTSPTVDVILRGDPAVAAGTYDTVAAWDGQLVFKDVAVVRLR